MLHDFDLAETPAPGHADVCIAGAGAAGILLATQLAAAGRTVTLLEGGGRDQEARSQEIYRSELNGSRHLGVHEGRFRTYGGSTTTWGGQILELDPEDFQRRPHVPESGWPFPKSTLDPFYERALRFEGLSRIERDDAQVLTLLGLQPLDLGPDFQTLYSRWTPERNFAALHARRLANTRRLTTWTHASVTALNLSPTRSQVESLTIRGFSGRQATVTADVYVLCLGGIETNRLLLQPMREGIAPWQANGLLGRHFQDHIGIDRIPLLHVQAQPVHRYFGYVDLNGFVYHQKIRLSPAQQAAHRTLNVAGTIGALVPENRARDRANVTLRALVRNGRKPTAGEAIEAAIQLPGILKRAITLNRYGEAPLWKQTMLSVHAEQEPTSASRISLGDQRDELGLLRTKLRWEISAEELHTIRQYIKLAAETFAAKHLASIAAPPEVFTDDAHLRSLCGDSNHHMGGTRMSSGPTQGIVDHTLKLHGLANAYICSSSVFPCSGYSNPTHTLLALGVRLADHLAEGIAPPAFNLTTRNAIANEQFHDLTVPAMTLPGTQQPTTQLGFGCAYLLGPGLDRAKSRRLLDAAYDAGIRHFDTARLYGQGHTESLLRDFLRAHPDATITTKYGIRPPNPAQRIVEALQRRIPPFAHSTRFLKRNDRAAFTAADARASLEISLRHLGRDHIDLFLLHEPSSTDLAHDDLLAFLRDQKTAGTVGNYGIGGEFGRMRELHTAHPGYTPVLQFEHSIFGPHLDVGASARIHYRAFAPAANALGRCFTTDPALAQRWSQAVDAELEEPLILSRLLLKAALIEQPTTLTLFSTASEAHILDNAQVAADSALTAPAQRLLELVRQDDLGIGRELYGPPS